MCIIYLVSMNPFRTNSHIYPPFWPLTSLSPFGVWPLPPQRLLCNLLLSPGSQVNI